MIGLSHLLILVMLLVIFVMVKKNTQDVKELRKDKQLPKPSGLDSSTEDVSTSEVTEVTNSEDQPEVKTDQKLTSSNIVTETIESSPQEEPDTVSQESSKEVGDGLLPGKTVSTEGAAPFTSKGFNNNNNSEIEKFQLKSADLPWSTTDWDGVFGSGQLTTKSVFSSTPSPTTLAFKFSDTSTESKTRGANDNKDDNSDKFQFKSSDTSKFKSSGNGSGRFERIEEKRGGIFGFQTKESVFLPSVPTFSATVVTNKSSIPSPTSSVFKFRDTSTENKPREANNNIKNNKKVFGFQTNESLILPSVPAFSATVVTTKSVFSSNPNTTTTTSAFKFSGTSTESKTRGANTAAPNTPSFSVDFSGCMKSFGNK